jgi:hypothetical protein
MYPDSPFALPVGSFRAPVPLPDVDPDSGTLVSVCFNPAWLPYIIGSLKQLLLQTTWDTNDPDDLALVQQRATNLIGLFQEGLCNAMFDIRIDPENACMLQKTTDGGANWVNIGSMYTCAYATAGEAIRDAIDNGIIGGSPQSSPESGPPVGECHTFKVTLSARDRWLCPFPVSSGYTVHVTAPSGGWWDGDTVTGRWYCPNGKQYLLGACGSDIGYLAGDPLQAGNHMQVVGNVGSDWGDPMASIWTVPTGHTQEALYLQANDDPLSDNQGTVTFEVEVCANGWCYTFDFTASDGGFVADPDSSFAQYVSSTGWQDSGVTDKNHVIYISRAFDAAQVYSVKLESDGLINVINQYIYLYYQGSLVKQAVGYPGSNPFQQSWDLTPCDKVFVATQAPLHTHNPNTIIRVTLYGQGDNPFGTDNCS